MSKQSKKIKDLPLVLKVEDLMQILSIGKTPPIGWCDPGRFTASESDVSTGFPGMLSKNICEKRRNKL